jgi:hypothetical protein
LAGIALHPVVEVSVWYVGPERLSQSASRVYGPKDQARNNSTPSSQMNWSYWRAS